MFISYQFWREIFGAIAFYTWYGARSTCPFFTFNSKLQSHDPFATEMRNRSKHRCEELLSNTTVLRWKETNVTVLCRVPYFCYELNKVADWWKVFFLLGSLFCEILYLWKMKILQQKIESLTLALAFLVPLLFSIPRVSFVSKLHISNLNEIIYACMWRCFLFPWMEFCD